MREIKLYNTLGRKIEIFKPIKQGQISMYHCGPTVYDTPHIGNYRTFILADILRRIFEYNGYEVHQVMNITDVDDKTIRRSQEEHITLKELTSKYESLFLTELDELNIKTPKNLTRATDYIDEMIRIIDKLIKDGFAYKANDGVYMSVEKIEQYGELAQLPSINKDHKVARINNDEYDKESTSDFVLWKFESDQDGGNAWDSTFGRGRPGWHIECSAMSMKKLGPEIDIHSGAQDLIFPHHTNEIAQSEAFSGKHFVNYWVHGGFMTIKLDKMSKSKGNITKISDLKDNMISPLAYRYWLYTAHYRSTIDFNLDALKASQTALIKLMNHLINFPENGEINEKYKKLFIERINNDLDLPQAIALVWQIIKDVTISDADKRATILDFDKVLGLGLDKLPIQSENITPPEIQVLIEARDEARKQKDWKKADAMRQEIEDRGYEIRDVDGKTIAIEK